MSQLLGESSRTEQETAIQKKGPDARKESGRKKRINEMKRFARMLFAGLGIVIAGSAISLLPQKAATAGSGAPVMVTNTPLPVTQSGPWNVGITGTPSVNANITNQVPVTGTVNANVSFPANQQVTLALASLLNLGKLPSQQLVLTQRTTGNPCPAWVDSNTSQCFSGIRAGFVFVIKDIEWTASTIITSPSISGNPCQLNFFGPGFSDLFSSYGDSDSLGTIGKTEHLAGGLYFNPAVIGTSAPTWTLSNAECSNGLVTLQGYLVPNQ